MNYKTTDVSSLFLLPKQKKREHIEKVFEIIFFLCAALSILTTVGIIGTLVFQSIPFFQEISILEFLGGTRWSPILKPQDFGVLPLLMGTILVSVIALGFAVPIGLLIAIFLSEYAPLKLRSILKPILEILAGIPTVVYGYFALTFVTPQLQSLIPNLMIFNALSAGLVMGLMITPMICSLSEDAMMAVPQSLRNAGLALGARKMEVSTKIVVPAASSGIIASCLLAFSRAIGETMLVTIAAGATPKMSINPLESIQTMTAYIVQLALGETPHGSLEYNTIFAVGLLLFIVTLFINLIGHLLIQHWKEPT